MHTERRPATLRQLAGLATAPPTLAEATLIVIDAQMAYAAGGALAVDGEATATRRIADLLDRARTAGSSVVHVAHRGGAGSAFDPLDGGRFIADTQPVAGEPVVHKTLPNAFAGTDLLELINEDRSRRIVLCGFMTHMCVSSTARAALDLELETTVVSDATGTRSLPSTTSQAIVPAEAVHEAALAALADRFSIVTTARRLLDAT